ncbi:MAG: GtrA family protein [Anaerolineales bacterium]|nr:GtrA family protein [Anaerolineales bacterium]
MVLMADRPARIKHPEFVTVLRFAVVGAAGTIVDLLLLALLTTHTSLPMWVANMVSYSSGIILNYQLNRHWTFRQGACEGVGRKFLQFSTISLAGMVLNTLILSGFEPVFARLGIGDWNCLPAKVTATGIVFFWNYVLNRLWTFRDGNPA